MGCLAEPLCLWLALAITLGAAGGACAERIER